MICRGTQGNADMTCREKDAGDTQKDTEDLQGKIDNMQENAEGMQRGCRGHGGNFVQKLFG